LLATVFQEVQDEFEALLASVVGVGDFVVIGEVFTVVAKGFDFVVMGGVLGEVLEVAEVGIVHGEDAVKGVEVFE